MRRKPRPHHKPERPLDPLDPRLNTPLLKALNAIEHRPDYETLSPEQICFLQMDAIFRDFGKAFKDLLP
jgi:hypothetical protein